MIIVPLAFLVQNLEEFFHYRYQQTSENLSFSLLATWTEQKKIMMVSYQLREASSSQIKRNICPKTETSSSDETIAGLPSLLQA
jgi:hypothetical protein